MDKEKLRAVQMVQLSIMKDIHRVCVENQLRYYLIGGSALGAIRHKGVIPWDVDIDIAMPREDYDLFISKYSKNLAPKLECVSYKTVKKYSPPHAMVILKNSMLQDRSGQRQTDLRPSEIFVDILPLDICPESDFLKKLQAEELKFIKNLKSMKAGWIYKKDSAFSVFLKKTRSTFLAPFSWRFLNSWQERVMTKYDKTSQSGIWCSMVSHYGYKKLSMSEKIFGKPYLVDFEDTQLYVPEKVIEYLTLIFGDYMRLPSEAAQKDQMNVFVDARW